MILKSNGKKTLSVIQVGKIFLYLAVFVALGACTSEPMVKKDRMLARSIVILPITSVHDELLKGAGKINNELEKRLSDEGFDVFQLPAQKAAAYRRKALEMTGSVYDPKVKKSLPLDKSTYLYHLIQLAAKEYDFDLIASPQLWLRTTRVNIDEAQWDGITREIEFIDKPASTYKLPKAARGVSLRMNVHSRNGGMVDSSFGGISLPYRIDYADGKAGFALKRQFYTHREIKEGVKIVLSHLRTEVRAQ